MAWGLMQKSERGVRNAPAATGRRFGAPGVALIGDGGLAAQGSMVCRSLGPRECHGYYN